MHLTVSYTGNLLLPGRPGRVCVCVVNILRFFMLFIQTAIQIAVTLNFAEVIACCSGLRRIINRFRIIHSSRSEVNSPNVGFEI